MQPSIFLKANKTATCILIGTTKHKSIYIRRVSEDGIHLLSEDTNMFHSNWFQVQDSNNVLKLSGLADLYLRSAEAALYISAEAESILQRLWRIS